MRIGFHPLGEDLDFETGELVQPNAPRSANSARSADAASSALTLNEHAVAVTLLLCENYRQMQGWAKRRLVRRLPLPEPREYVLAGQAEISRLLRFGRPPLKNSVALRAAPRLCTRANLYFVSLVLKIRTPGNFQELAITFVWHRWRGYLELCSK